MSTPLAEKLYNAFWRAAETLGEDPTVHDMDKPYFDQGMGIVDAGGDGIPMKFWEHFAGALEVECSPHNESI